MNTYNGPLLKEDGFIQTEIGVEEREIKTFEEGGDGGENAIIIPAFYDSHTHIADSVVDEPPTGTIEEIVGPGGLKERELRSAGKEETIISIKNYMKEMVSYGVSHFIDFREDGIEGIKLLKEAFTSLEKDLSMGVLGRPKKRRYNHDELEEILSMSDGIGLSAYRDWDESHLRSVADNTAKKDKPLALHCSEDVREPVEEVLDLSVHHLIHMIEADDSDLERCAEEEIPIIVCPRSNMFFGKMPNIPKMIEHGITLSLGTDNAMVSNSNIFREMETAYRVSRMKGDISPIEILKMSTWNPRKTLKLDSFDDRTERYLVLKKKSGDPAFNLVVNTSPKDIIETVWCEDGRI